MLLIINKLAENNKLNIKLFFISCGFFSLVIAIDVIIQVIFEKNLIGLEITNYKPSSFFGSENIAGGFLQRFILFLIFLIILNIKKNKSFIFFILSYLFMIPILLTQNRMSFITYFMSLGLFFLLEKKFKQTLIIVILGLSLISYMYKNAANERFDIEVRLFLQGTLNLITKAPKLFIYNSLNGDNLEFNKNGYLIHFNSGIQIWKEKKLFGHGLKSFPLNCKFIEFQTCNTHPHNYFIEILLDTGIVGLILIYTIIILSLFDNLKIYFSKINKKFKLILAPVILLVAIEFFPLRSTGSFFSTYNSVYIFMMIAFLINLKKISNLFFHYKK